MNDKIAWMLILIDPEDLAKVFELRENFIENVRFDSELLTYISQRLSKVETLNPRIKPYVMEMIGYSSHVLSFAHEVRN